MVWGSVGSNGSIADPPVVHRQVASSVGVLGAPADQQ